MQLKPPALIHFRRAWLLLLAAALTLLLAACAPVNETPASTLNILVVADGKQIAVQTPAGSSVQSALEKAGVQLASMDRIDPPGFSLLTAPVAVKVTRVREEFEVREVVIPFEEQTVRNELLPKDDVRRIQKGLTGLKQETYRRVFEDGVEVSNTLFKSEILTEARPEIVMVGVQLPFTPIPLPGRLAYLTAGNAWVMEGTTGDRKPLVTSGDLDGYIFSLSADGTWLLYSRKAPEDAQGSINSLWAVRVTDENPEPINLQVNNVIHFADWVPGESQTISYSTVEPRAAPPGWQANNDLHSLSILPGGGVGKSKELLETNTGGIYGWWGTTFAWSPDGSRLAYARPDGVGLVDLAEGELQPLMEMLPLQTGRDWAWVPGISWSPDGRVLYTVDHGVDEDLPNPEESQLFHVTALAVSGDPAVPLALQSGMFAYPTAMNALRERSYPVAFLQARFPLQSETSNYRVWLMDRDGSNQVPLFPAEGTSGIGPQQVIWSPAAGGGNPRLGVLSEGNIFFIDIITGEAQKVTGDGSISRMDWQ
jgi:hypothetical protein